MPYIIFGGVDIAIRLNKQDVNKCEGPDSINSRVLAEYSEILANHLKIVFEKLMNLNILPQVWQSGNSTYYFQNGSELDA